MDPEAAKDIVDRLIAKWNTSYRHSLRNNRTDPCIVDASFCKPQPNQPAPSAVANVEFLIDADKEEVVHYRIEGERHVYKLKDDIEFDEILLDRIIDRKLKIKESSINLADEYINSRVTKVIADAKEAQEAKEAKEKKAAKDMKESDQLQAASKDSTVELEEYLIKQFKEADKNGQGWLSYQEFHELLVDLNLNITREDIGILFAYADENDDGQIEYQEFVPLAVELINGLSHHGAKADQKLLFEEDKKNKEAFYELQRVELEDTIDVLSKIFEAADYRPPHRKQEQPSKPALNRVLFRRCLTAPVANLTKEEVNMMTALAPTDDEGRILYEGFEELLYDVKYRIARSQRVALIADLEKHLEELFQSYEIANSDADESAKGEQPLTGKISRAAMMEALERSNRLMLTKFQIFSIVSEAHPDNNGFIDYREFSPKLAVTIQDLYDPEIARRRAEVIQRAKIQPAEFLHGKDRDALEDALYAEFQKHDSDGNGVLDIDEFRSCLTSGTILQLEDKSINQLICIADANGDGVIDYGEFVDICYQHLLRLAREQALEVAMQDSAE